MLSCRLHIQKYGITTIVKMTKLDTTPELSGTRARVQICAA